MSNLKMETMTTIPELIYTFDGDNSEKPCCKSENDHPETDHMETDANNVQGRINRSDLKHLQSKLSQRTFLPHQEYTLKYSRKRFIPLRICFHSVQGIIPPFECVSQFAIPYFFNCK